MLIPGTGRIRLCGLTRLHAEPAEVYRAEPHRPAVRLRPAAAGRSPRPRKGAAVALQPALIAPPRRRASAGSSTTPPSTVSANTTGRRRTPRRRPRKAGTTKATNNKGRSSSARHRVETTCSVTTCPQQGRLLRLLSAAANHKKELAKLEEELATLEAVIVKRDAAIVELEANPRRELAAEKARHLATLNSLQEKHGLHIQDLKQRNDIRNQRTELTVRELLARIERYRTQRDTEKATAERLRVERDALRTSAARDRQRAIFPGTF